MKQLIAVGSLTLFFSTIAFAGGPVCGPGYSHDDQGGCSPNLLLNEDDSAAMTMEKILFLNQRGEETEAAVCCSWVEDQRWCMPSC